MKALATVMASVVLSVATMLGLIHTMPPVQENYTLLRQASYAVEGFKDSGPTCSGTLIADYTLLTAAHCETENMTVNGAPAVVIKKDVEKDLMLLAVNAVCPCVPLAEAGPAIDTSVVVVGYPLGISQHITIGAVQAPILQKGYEHLMTLTAPLAPGNSGGGVFVKTEDGWRLVGVSHAIAVAAVGGFIPNLMPHLAAAIGFDAIKHFLGE